MKWIKSHLTIVVCGAVSTLAVALLVLGIVMSGVQETMARDASVVQSLATASPVNERILKQYEHVFETNSKQLEAIHTKLKERGNYEPLHPDVFPEFSKTNPGARFQFKTLLLAAQRKMVSDLKANQAPTPQEEAIEAQEMKDQKERALLAESLGAGSPKPQKAPGVFGPTEAGPAPMTLGMRGEVERRRDMTPEQMAEEYPEVRLAIRRARDLWCYVGTDEETFGKWPDVTTSSNPPVEAMWYAQMSLWIQQDVVKALVEVNKRTAEAIKARQQEPWVGNLPVKHVKRIAINGYASAGPSAAPTPETAGTARPLGELLPSFTQQPSTKIADVIQFNVDLVVEARLLPSVIDEICKAGFFTPVLVKYEIQPANLNWSGYIYGSAPALHVSIDVEGSFLRAKYEKWIPETVKKEIEAGQAKFQQGLATAGVGPGMGPQLGSPGLRPAGPGGRGIGE